MISAVSKLGSMESVDTISSPSSNYEPVLTQMRAVLAVCLPLPPHPPANCQPVLTQTESGGMSPTPPCPTLLPIAYY